MESASDESATKAKPKRRVITKHLPAPKRVLTPALILAILSIFIFVGLVIAAAFTYKPPKSDEKPKTPGTKPPTQPKPDNKPKESPKVPPPPVDWEWVGGNSISGKTSKGTPFEMFTSWVGPAGTYKNIRITIKLTDKLDDVSRSLSPKDGTFSFTLYNTPIPFQTMMYELYDGKSLYALKDGTDPWYFQNGIQWQLTANMTASSTLDKKSPTGNYIHVAPPALVAQFSKGALTTIPTGTINFETGNLF